MHDIQHLHLLEKVRGKSRRVTNRLHATLAESRWQRCHFIEKSPSGERDTPSRSTPLDLCSTEDHSYHLQNKAATKRYFQPTPWHGSNQEVWHSSPWLI